MPNFSALAHTLNKSLLRVTLFIFLLLTIAIAAIDHSMKTPRADPVAHSQDIAQITALAANRSRLDYLLLAQPQSDSPRYIIKYKDQPGIVVVTVPGTTHMNLEREVLLKNGIPYAIAQPEWLAQHEDVLQDASGRSSLWQTVSSFFERNAVGLVLLILMLFAMKKGLPGMGFSSTLLKPEQIKGSMDDLIGMDDIKREVSHLEDMIRHRDLYKSHNIDKPFNVMLTGPAGTGKTRLAGYLAKKLGIPLIQASGSGLESGLVGGGAKALNAMYKKACAQGRCLIFLDEAQSLFMPRGRGERKWDDDTANTLLGLLDGIQSEQGREVIWVVASNFDEINSEMDEAMLRRFSVKINFRLPNKAERRALLQNFLQRKEAHCVAWEQLNLDYAAEITANLSPALLEAVVERASMIAIEENKKIDTDLLFRAFERCAIGLADRATTAEKDKQRERIAIHELGHFFMQIDPLLRKGMSLEQVKTQCALLKISTESVSRMGALGYVLSTTADAPLLTLEELEQEVMQLYGGVAAEELFYGARGISVGSQNDIQKATGRLDLMISQLSMYSHTKLDYRQLQRETAQPEALRQVEAKSDELYARTLNAMRNYADLITALKTALLERYVLSKDEVFSLLDGLMHAAPKQASPVSPALTLH
jgi:cell division protease FtsH